METKTPIIKRPSLWTFLSAGVAFASIYFVQDKVDPTLLLDSVKAFLALLGLGAVTKLSYDKYQESKTE